MKLGTRLSSRAGHANGTVAQRCNPHGLKLRLGRRALAGFTLAEVLAALLFMAIVIPVSVQALRIASLAGEVSERKTQAVRVAERLLNESIATTNLSTSSAGGTVTEGTREYRWTLQSEPWSQLMTNQLPVTASAMGQIATPQPQVNQFAVNQIMMNLLSVEVKYTVQNQDYAVHLSTLMNSQQ